MHQNTSAVSAPSRTGNEEASRQSPKHRVIALREARKCRTGERRIRTERHRERKEMNREKRGGENKRRGETKEKRCGE